MKGSFKKFRGASNWESLRVSQKFSRRRGFHEICHRVFFIVFRVEAFKAKAR